MHCHVMCSTDTKGQYPVLMLAFYACPHVHSCPSRDTLRIDQLPNSPLSSADLWILELLALTWALALFKPPDVDTRWTGERSIAHSCMLWNIGWKCSNITQEWQERKHRELRSRYSDINKGQLLDCVIRAVTAELLINNSKIAQNSHLMLLLI